MINAKCFSNGCTCKAEWNVWAESGFHYMQACDEHSGAARLILDKLYPALSRTSVGEDGELIESKIRY